MGNVAYSTIGKAFAVGSGIMENRIYITDDYFKRCQFPGSFIYREKDGEVKQVCIQRVIYSNPATIVFWDDGTKTTVKCFKDDVYNPETGLAMCVLKKCFGTTKVKNLVDTWIPKGKEYKAGSAPVVQTLKDVRAAARK